MEIMILVSRCLLGDNCKYNGGNNGNEQVIAYLKNHSYIAVCPECEGGLPTPRPPAEIRDGRVLNRDGEEVTAYFQAGAEKTLALAKEHRATHCILKDGSPSCGVHRRYDGHFHGVCIPGLGITAALLREHGFQIFSETEVENLPETH